MSSPRVARVLDTLFGLSCVIGLYDAQWMATGFGAPLRGWLIFVALAVAIGAWVWRRRARGRAPVILLLGAVLLGILLSDGPLLLPLVLVAILVAVLDLGLLAGAAFITVTILGLAAVMLLAHDVPAISIVAQCLGLVLMFGFGIAYASLVREVEAARAAHEAATARLDETNARLHAANDRLRAAAATERDLVLAQERARSARELHDGLGHRLTVVTMSLDFAERMRERDPGRAWAEVRAARETTAEAMREMRLWVRALHPVDVGDLTDVAAFDAIAESFRGTGLDVRVEVSGAPRELPAPVSLLCHRAVQEGLTNALRHAAASRVVIAVDLAPDELRLTLSDNGIGGPAGGLAEGFGLRSLRERAEALDGGASVETAEGRGTALSIRVPLPPAEASATAAPVHHGDAGATPAETGATASAAAPVHHGDAGAPAPDVARPEGVASARGVGA